MNKYILKSIISIIIFTSCDDVSMPRDRVVNIVNQSSKEIHWVINSNYPDTLLPMRYENSWGKSPIKANKNSNFFLNCEYDNKKEIFPTDTLATLIFIDSDTIAKYRWEEIKNDDKIAKRVFISSYLMKEVNWTISYP